MIGLEGRRLHVLVVDDNESFRRLLRTILVSVGVTDVMECPDGQAALDLLQTYPADLVLLDYKMLPLDGLAFMRILRSDADSPNPYLPAIMISGYIDTRLIAQARDAGINEFLAKPISAKSLLTRVIAAIDSPRPFIKAPGYFGPDRRRRHVPPTGPDRRNQSE